MKQYKFKYNGEWHDIQPDTFGNYQAQFQVRTNPFSLRESSFKAVEPTLSKLLASLRNLNIEVAEVCDRLRWSYDPIYFWITDWFLLGEDVVRYWISSGAERHYLYLQNNEDFSAIDIGVSATVNNAKAACQADFNKRRAR